MPNPNRGLFGRALSCVALAIVAACEGQGPGEGNAVGATPLDAHASGAEGTRFGVVTGGIYQSGAHRLDANGDAFFGEITTGLGVGWIRVEAGWGGLSNALLGQLVEKAHAHGLQVVVVLQAPLDCPPGQHVPCPAADADIQDYVQNRLDPLLQEAFASNAAHPDAIETGNEINGSRWGGNMTAWLARRVKEHLLAGGRWSDIKVVSAGTANTYARDETGWYEPFFTSGAFRCVAPAPALYGCAENAAFMPFDFMAVHPYDGAKVDLACVNATSPDRVDCFGGWKQWVKDDIAHVRDRLQQVSGTRTELMVTEFGWQSPPTGWSQPCPDDMGVFHNCVRTPDQMRAAMQASYEAFHTDSPWAWSVHAALWYDAIDDDPGPKHFGTRLAGGAVRDDVWQKLRGLTGDPSRGVPDEFWSGQKFLDEPPNDWAYTFVEGLAADGILDGQPDGNFGAGHLPTRGELATALGRALTYGTIAASGHRYGTLPLASPSGATFSDVSTGDPRFQYVETLAANGIIGGYSDGTFRPQNTLTRGQAVKMFVLGKGWAPEDPQTPTFTDVPRDNAFYGYVEAAHSHQLIDGYGDGTFRPNASLTRAQIAKILYRSFVGQ